MLSLFKKILSALYFAKPPPLPHPKSHATMRGVERKIDELVKNHCPSQTGDFTPDDVRGIRDQSQVG
jgi:hypothetical protein